MSFTKYRKNYHANGYGWHNLAAVGYAEAPKDTTSISSGSSGVSSLYPSSYLSMPPLPGGGMPMPGMPPLPGSMPQMPGMPSPSSASSMMPPLPPGPGSNIGIFILLMI